MSGWQGCSAGLREEDCSWLKQSSSSLAEYDGDGDFDATYPVKEASVDFFQDCCREISM